MSASVWKKSSFFQIGNVIAGGTPSTKNLEYWNGDIPFVTPNDLSDTKTPYIDNTERNITKLGLSKSSANLLPNDTLVISTRAPIGYMAISSTECVTNQGCKSIVFDKNQCPLFHYYNTHNYIQKMKSLGSGTTFAEISKSDLEKITVLYPQDISEQKHISDILSTCDNVIANTQKAIDKYKAIKQGMMQDLFTRGLTKDGKLRPSYQDAPHLYKKSELGMIPKEWEVKFLPEVATIIMGQSPSTDSYNEKYGVPLIQGNADIKNRECIINGFTTSITKAGHHGDIVMTVRAPVGNVAHNSLECCLGRGVCALRNSNEYLYNYLIYIENDWWKYSTGSTFDSINSQILEKINIKRPTDITEQTEIAKRLSSIDSTIQKEEAILAKYKNIKIGLMARLLTVPQDAQIIDETGEE